jgi:hypothetical protein
MSKPLSLESHVTADELVDYFAMRLDADRERAIELHLADCDACVGEARHISELAAGLRRSASPLRPRRRDVSPPAHAGAAALGTPAGQDRPTQEEIAWLRTVAVLAFAAVRTRRRIRGRGTGASSSATIVEWTADAASCRLRRSANAWVFEIESSDPTWVGKPVRFVLADAAGGPSWAEGFLLLVPDPAGKGRLVGGARFRPVRALPDVLHAEVALCEPDTSQRPDLTSIRAAVGMASSAQAAEAWRRWLERWMPQAWNAILPDGAPPDGE